MSDSVNVLMVDDELVVLEAFVDILQDEGYTMFTADSGNKAVEILRANPIDIVVADIKMPGMDGLELLSIIHEMDAEIPVIMATAYSSIENTVESMRRGASNYLIKPIKVELLRSLLAEAAGKRRMLRENRELANRIQRSNEELKRLNEEQKRVLEVIAQNLRQPLIDQMNWCELLMTDNEHSLHTEHLESIAKLNSAANKMFTQVQDLLNEEKIEERARAIKEITAVEKPASSAELKAPASFDVVLHSENRSDFKILLVENSSTLRDVLFNVLQRKFHVFSAQDGWGALRLMVERPQLILTELDLPHVDAVEMVRTARHILGNVAVLAMYDAKDKALLAAAKQLGVQEAVLKPFHIADVIAKVEALAEASKAQMSNSILVVCPDPDERYALYHLLDTRYRTHIVASAEAAMEATETHFDMLIIDIATGKYLWQDVVTCLRERYEDIKVLALTDGNNREMGEALNKVHIDSVMPKPYSFDDLLSHVRGLLGMKEIDGSILRSVLRTLA